MKLYDEVPDNTRNVQSNQFKAQISNKNKSDRSWTQELTFFAQEKTGKYRVKGS